MTLSGVKNVNELVGRFFKASILVYAAVFMSVAHADENDYEDIARLINQRLVLMKDVAKYKAIYQQPVEDLNQEERVLSASLKKARLLGLDGSSVKPFIQAQIEAAKTVQYCYLANWLFMPEYDEEPQDLDRTRRELSEIIDVMLVKSAKILKKQQKINPDCSFMQYLQQPELKQSDKEDICRSLKNITLSH